MLKILSMAFNHYQAQQYIKYLSEHQKQLEKIYKLIEGWPFSSNYLAALLDMNANTFRKRFAARSLQYNQLKALLNHVQ